MIVIKSPKTKDEFKAYYQLRYRALREPWGQPKGTEKDDFEPISQHFMALDEAKSEIVGGVKLFEKAPGVGQFSHMVVLESRRGQGIGRLLIETVEQAARQNGYQVLGTTTRLNTTGFFEKYGYKAQGMPTHLFGTTQLIWVQKEL